ncbi:homodimeric glycerol 3-phosphate dehydrogenase (quinone) [Rhizobium sp. PP-F2F-G38]|uniref:Glycerol-3-phosphate dehydrogenase n=1 Tax=Ferranicluibacter rubi TaxID=2715133 RepID=A0AA44CBY8_9HYPH|nr:glycerol-3-phosphate dehydrogenase [Ferranicluibacter rubi]PYE34074.1 homodimeric glycerol 3-phosphate dehydrogenase (quinone) [Rhizobium sp. PP-WC-1G-195]PYE96710.1 homodimeric glycerol 3-phosphate dehydrogenase (quinone) [Rhizobium sp. PP-F2F-G38]TCP86122.1 homodimeric glycerol 3-phosphate dehydrogenase (quinone) [Rhizobium sp. PP-CC-2G-626]TCQ23605.1 homodimeric glycerol 3-phosphate dehydrogenase (quinone) [Rhizobium sp. PP-CC-3G-465]NHT77329.1 glycerol-3-phosphate dehydrogenase [Ferrani
MTGQEPFDIFVIGGGINGCGIARDAIGRGYSVGLAEMNDFASGTSSGATKLIHGGLRYLEHYEFRLVRESLMEREVLWAMAPHIIWPMRFVLPFHKGGIRPAWLIRLGLFLYDHIGGRKLLPATKTLDMRRDPAGKPLKPLFTKAFEYSDGWVDDARLVVLNARDAANRGAEILSRSRVVSARREGKLWAVDIQEGKGGPVRRVTARMLVNAAGPWVDRVLSNAVGKNEVHNVRLVQGSHIVIRQKFNDPRAYFFQNPDGRIIFAIPYERDFTLIGTTDQDFTGDPKDIRITDAETDYLCKAASEYFAEPVRREDIVWSYSGVRPLFDDGASKAQEATRDYVLKVEADDGAAPLLNVFGGKLTTYRRLAEHALEKIGEAIGDKGVPWTAKSTLPGGDFAPTGYEAEVAALKNRYGFLSDRHARRLVRLYGTLAGKIVGDAQTIEALGRHYGADLYEAEVRYLIEQEWARTAEDILWRRTKLGLNLSGTEASALADDMQNLTARCVA